MDWSDLVPDNIKNKNNDIDEPAITFKINPTHDYCSNCHVQMSFANNSLVCYKCGKQAVNITHISEEEYTSDSFTNYNVVFNGYTSFKFIGSGSNKYQQRMYQSSSKYHNYRSINTKRQMNNWNNRNIGVVGGIFIPKYVINLANEEFEKIKKHKYVYRNEGKDGVLSALLYYECYKAGITKTPTEIAKFSGIEEKFHSLGDRILHKLHEKGIIEIPVKIYPIPDYVDRFMDILNINKKYRAFILDIITRAENKKIHVLHDSKATTRVIGSIYLLTTRIEELKHITKERIEQECNISKATFIRYYNTIFDYYKKFKKVFKRHGIPMPREWAKDYKKPDDKPLALVKPKRITKIAKPKLIKIKKPPVIRKRRGTTHSESKI